MELATKNSINNFLVIQNQIVNEADIEVFQKFFEQDISLNTKKAMLSDIKHFIKWYIRFGEGFSFARLTIRDIIDYKNESIQSLKHKPTTINRRLVNLRSLCKLAVELGRIKVNPAEKIKQLPIQSLAPKGLTKQELRRLLKEVELRGSLRDQLIIELMCGAGLRVSELANLKVDDVFLSDRKGTLTLRYAKGGKTRKVPLNSQIRSLMKEFMDKSKPAGHLFTGQRGNLTNIAFNKIVEVYANKAQIKCSPHTLRHTFAYNYLKKNQGEIVGLGQLLGHSNINTTAIYTQHRLEDLQERVEGL